MPRLAVPWMRLTLVAAMLAPSLSLPACRLASKDAGGGERPAPGTKRGVAYDLTSQADADALGPQVSWYYNWSTHPGAALTGVEFVPMVWGKLSAADVPAIFAACAAKGGCRVDHVAVHAYVCYGGALGWYLDRFAKYGKPLWLTEFSCADEASRKGSTKGQADYMAEAVPLLEGRADVFRYAWFIGRSNPVDPAWPVDLLGADGKLTWLGQTYVGFPGAP